MRTLFFCVLGAALLVAPPQIRDDEHLQRSITLPPVAAYAQDLGERLQTLSGSTVPALEVLDDSQGALVIGRADHSKAADCLEAFAIALSSEWIKTAQGWTLTRQPQLRRLAQLNVEGRRVEIRKNVLYLRGQGLRLQSLLSTRGYLNPGDLDLAGQQAFKAYVQAEYHYTAGIAPEALQLDGCRLVLKTYTLEDHVDLCLSTELPCLDGRFIPIANPRLRAITREEMARLPIPERRKWCPPPRHLPSLSKSRYHAANLKGEALQQRVPARSSAVNEVARVLVQQKVPVFVGTYHHLALARVPEQPTAAAAMEAIAKVTGGTWRQVGPLYALEPHPLVERCAQLKPEARDFWRQELVKRIKDTLSPKQKERLADQGYLKPRDLREEQRVAATWLTALEFVQFNQPAAACLDQEPRLEREPNGYALTYRDAAEAETRRIRLQ